MNSICVTHRGQEEALSFLNSLSLSGEVAGMEGDGGRLDWDEGMLAWKCGDGGGGGLTWGWRDAGMG